MHINSDYIETPSSFLIAALAFLAERVAAIDETSRPRELMVQFLSLFQSSLFAHESIQGFALAAAHASPLATFYSTFGAEAE